MSKRREKFSHAFNGQLLGIAGLLSSKEVAYWDDPGSGNIEATWCDEAELDGGRQMLGLIAYLSPTSNHELQRAEFIVADSDSASRAQAVKPISERRGRSCNFGVERDDPHGAPIVKAFSEYLFDRQPDEIAVCCEGIGLTLAKQFGNFDFEVPIKVEDL